HIMTKNRMLEVYFNIIEWGRNVYGIGEASRYYFGKTPAELNLGESIYLASIVPNPKAGLYAFLPNGTIRPGLLGYFNLIGKMMAMRGETVRDSSGYGFYDVHLKESLRREIAPINPAVADSLMNQSDDEDIPIIEPEKKPTFFQRLFGRRDTVAKTPPKKNEARPMDPKQKLKADIQKLRDDEKKEEGLIDTAGKTRKEMRQEKRRLRNEEKEKEKQLKN